MKELWRIRHFYQCRESHYAQVEARVPTSRAIPHTPSNSGHSLGRSRYLRVLLLIDSANAFIERQVSSELGERRKGERQAFQGRGNREEGEVAER